MYSRIDDHSYFSFSDIRPMEIDQPIAHLVDESQPTPNNMTNELMKDTQQLPVQLENVVLEEAVLDVKETEDFSRILQQYNILDDEYEQQNRYLATFGLQRNPIVGDGNCLFRAISFSLFGHQDNHLQLRNMAVETLRGNIDIFRNYFIDGPGTVEEQIDHFGQPSTYAGQECILALAMALNRNIMVTVGGDLNNRVATYENSFTPDQAHPHIHIIWRRAGGGHYESVTEQQQSLSFFPRNDPIGNKDNSRTKPWQKVSQFSRPVQMENIVTNAQSSIPPMHTYARQGISISPHDDSKMKLDKHFCPVCRISFKKPANLKNHVSKFHAGQGQGLAEDPNGKLQACMVSTCSLKFRTMDKLIEHAINVHKADINIEHLTFDQSSLFSEFRKREEIVSNTRFVKKYVPCGFWGIGPISSFQLGSRIVLQLVPVGKELVKHLGKCWYKFF